MACAIHCLLTPLVIGVLPIAGLGALVEESTETWIIGAAVVVTVASALWGFQRHRALRIVMTLFGAAGLLLLGHWLGERHPLGTALSIAGGVVIAGAHFWGARLCKACPGDHGHGHAGEPHAHDHDHDHDDR